MADHRPTTTLLLLSMSDGHVVIMDYVLADQRAGWRNPATKENVERVIAKYLELYPEWTCVSWRHMDRDERPVNDHLRNAWRYSKSGPPGVDMPSARELHREKLRELRAPKLAQADVEYMKALEDGDSAAKTRIAKQKQALRDVTDDPAIDAAQTPESLKAAIPAALGAE